MKKLPNWIAAVLRIGGILHIFLALGLVFYSNAILATLQAEIPFVPPSDWWIIVSGIGLLVVGIGYFISSFRPVKNAASLFMGFMSHLLMTIFLLSQLGTLSFSSLLAAGSIGLLLAWAVLGAFILYHISKARQAPQTLTHSYNEPLAKTLSRFRTHRGKSLLQLSNKQPVLLVFLRQLGSPFSKETLADIQRQKAVIEEEGTQLAFVHLSEEEQARAYFSRAGLDEVQRISDPNGIMYSAFGLERASYTQQKGWRGGIQQLSTLLQGNTIRAVLGKGSSMPGVFLINQGEIIKSYRRDQSASRPDYVSMATCKAA